MRSPPPPTPATTEQLRTMLEDARDGMELGARDAAKVLRELLEYRERDPWWTPEGIALRAQLKLMPLPPPLPPRINSSK